MTEGFLQNHIKSTLQSLRVAYGNPPLFTQGRLKLRLSANSQQIKNGRTQFAPTVRRRLHRIVRNSLWLSLTRYATPPFPQKSRSARLFGCKRPLDGSLSLPTFADLYIAFSRELSFINNNLTAAASHLPTTSSFAPYRSQQPLVVPTVV